MARFFFFVGVSSMVVHGVWASPRQATAEGLAQDAETFQTPAPGFSSFSRPDRSFIEPPSALLLNPADEFPYPWNPYWKPRLTPSTRGLYGSDFKLHGFVEPGRWNDPTQPYPPFQTTPPPLVFTSPHEVYPLIPGGLSRYPVTGYSSWGTAPSGALPGVWPDPIPAEGPSLPLDGSTTILKELPYTVTPAGPFDVKDRPLNGTGFALPSAPAPAPRASLTSPHSILNQHPGDRVFREGDFERARPAYDKALIFGEETAESYFRRAETAMLEGADASAVADVLKGLTLLPSNPAPVASPLERLAAQRKRFLAYREKLRERLEKQTGPDAEALLGYLDYFGDDRLRGLERWRKIDASLPDFQALREFLERTSESSGASEKSHEKSETP